MASRELVQDRVHVRKVDEVKNRTTCLLIEYCVYMQSRTNCTYCNYQITNTTDKANHLTPAGSELLQDQGHLNWGEVT